MPSRRGNAVWVIAEARYAGDLFVIGVHRAEGEANEIANKVHALRHEFGCPFKRKCRCRPEVVRAWLHE